MTNERDLVAHSVIITDTQSNATREFAAGTRLCVMSQDHSNLRLAEYAGCGPAGEVTVPSDSATLWRPKIGDRFAHIPSDDDVVTITEVEERGPGWHRAMFPNGEVYSVHDQELKEIEQRKDR